MAPVKTKFTEGEKVLCFHGPLIYEAKCLKVEAKPQTRYFIHYNGWNKNWDEWVQESRVMKCIEANYQKQKELQRAHIAAKANKKTKAQVVKKVDKKLEKGKSSPSVSVKKEKSSLSLSSSGRRTREGTPRSSTPVQSTPSTPTSSIQPLISTPSTSSQELEPKKKKPKSDILPPMVTVECEEIHNTKIEVRIKIPEDLKPWLVDDWDLITRQFRLIKHPPKKTVKNILDDYLAQKTNKSKDSAIVEVVNGINEYFNVMLGAQLLYKFERIQYAELLSENTDTPMSEHYGGIHLLRLFVKIGGMLSYTRLDEKSMTTLIGHLHDFLKFMSKNVSDLFSLNDYIVASPEYQRKAI